MSLSYGKTPVQVVIAWVLSREDIISVLIGPSTIEHLLENLGGVGWRLEEEDLKSLEDFLKEVERTSHKR